MKEVGTPSPTASPMFRRAQPQIRAVSTKQLDTPTSRPGKLVIRAGKSPERTSERNDREQKQTRGAYVNVLSEEGKRTEHNGVHESTDCTDGTDCNRGKVLRTLTSDTCHFDNEIIKSRVDTLNSKENDYCPEKLRSKGNTPKLTRKLLISNFDSPPSSSLLNSYCDVSKVLAETPENIPANRERKIKRSESYRMANSPIMFIKKISCNLDKSSKIIRTASEELREDLIKERINYPDSVASPTILESDFSESSWNNSNCGVNSPASPRPRAQDLEPARVLKYSSTDTEIW